MKDFVSFGIDFQSICFMSTRFLKDKIDWFCATLFQLADIRDKTYPSHKIWLSFFVKYIICGG